MTSSETNQNIIVVGACNVDLIAYVPRLPQIGETLKGTSFSQGFGGKGANQAVQAARLQGPSSQATEVIMLGKLGTDFFGQATLDNFQQQGVSTKFLLSTPLASSGVAPIAVCPDGHNSIVIVGGANDLLTPEETHRLKDVLPDAGVLIGQLEIPEHVTLAAFRLVDAISPDSVSSSTSSPSSLPIRILNTAPCPATISEDLRQLLLLADIVCPNEVELGQIVDLPIPSSSASSLESFLDAVRSAVTALRGLCAPRAVIICTLGERGCLLSTPDGTQEHIPVPVAIPPESVVDTSGAGDSFLGALARFIIELGMQNLAKAIRNAQLASALSVTQKGTQSSYPNRSQLDIFASR